MSERSEGQPEGSEGLSEGSKGLPEGSKCLPEGSEGQPVRPGGLLEGSVGLPGGLGGTDGRMYGWTDAISPQSTGLCPLLGPQSYYSWVCMNLLNSESPLIKVTILTTSRPFLPCFSAFSRFFLKKS